MLVGPGGPFDNPHNPFQRPPPFGPYGATGPYGPYGFGRNNKPLGDSPAPHGEEDDLAADDDEKDTKKKG